MDIREIANRNFLDLATKPYPGRGVVAGRTLNGLICLIYWIMGRSENSRNRVFKFDHNGRLYTEAADPAKAIDPSLIIYNAMLEGKSLGGMHFVVSNGSQTDTVIGAITQGRHPDDLEAILAGYKYEPDGPNWTPRITGLCSLWNNGHATFRLSILRKSPFGGDVCDRHSFRYGEIAPGFGYCITTYSGDGDPLPPFQGEPILVPIAGKGIDNILKDYSSALNQSNLVAVAVKTIHPQSGVSLIRVWNKNTKVV